MANCLRWQAAHAYKKPDQAVILRLAESRLTASTCQVFNSDMRLKISDRVVMYPDVQAACGKLRFEDGNEDVLLNPKLIVEVLSIRLRRGPRQKFRHYRQLESLSDYVL